MIILPDGGNSLMGGVDGDKENKEEEDYGDTMGWENSQASLEVQPRAGGIQRMPSNGLEVLHMGTNPLFYVIMIQLCRFVLLSYLKVLL